MLAFLIDQILQRCCRFFQSALTAARGMARLGHKLRGRFELCLLSDWGTLYRSVSEPPPLALGYDRS